MKVCHFTSVHPAFDVRIFHKECVSLAKNGHDVCFVVPNAKSAFVDGVQIIGFEAKINSRIKRMLCTTRKAYKLARKLNADVYHFHDPELIYYGYCLKRKGRKVIYDVHEDVPQQILGKFYINPWCRKFIAFVVKKIEDFIARRLDVIITATPYIKDRFLQINKNTYTVNNYPKLDDLSDFVQWEDKKNEICYIGGVSRIRGISSLVDAMELTRDVRLNIAGTYESKQYEEELKMMKGWSHVFEHGFVNRNKAVEIMSSSKAGIVNFLPLPNHVNAQPNKIFEYMSAGTPVIASHFPLWKEIIEKNNCGICVDPNDPKAIADAITYLLTHDDVAREMGVNGRKLIEGRFNWAIEEKLLLKIYDNRLKNE